MTPFLAQKDVKLRGLHNIENLLAAAAAVWGLVPVEAIQQVGSTFTGVEHRIEPVRTLDGVLSTTTPSVPAPPAPLRACAASTRRSSSLRAAYDKHIPYEPLAPEVIAHVRNLVLMGATGPRIEKAVRECEGFDEAALPIQHADNMQHAVELARAAAKPGDIIILSPASASFDLVPLTLRCAAVSSRRSSTRSSDRDGSTTPARRRPSFRNACRGRWVLDALLPLDQQIFGKSQPGRFYAGPTLALELSGRTAWAAGHANPEELASFLAFCGCGSVILDEGICPPPTGWHRAETLTVFGLAPGKVLPLPAVEDALWSSLTLDAQTPAMTVAQALYPTGPRPAGRCLFGAVLQAQPGPGRGLGAAAGRADGVHRGCLCGRKRTGLHGLRPDGRALARQRHRRAAHRADGQRPCSRRGAPGVPLRPGTGAFLHPPRLCKAGGVCTFCRAVSRTI